MPRLPRLYGFTSTNSSHTMDKLWSKNIFNSTFPVALACFMRDNGIRAKYIVLREDLQTEVVEISIEDLFCAQGLSPCEIFFDFESIYEPYGELVPPERPLTKKDKIDLVVRKMADKSPLAPLEIKLTVVPDKATARKSAESQGSEIVCRPVTTKYCALGIFEQLSPDERYEVSELLHGSYTAVNDWNHPDNLDDAGRYLADLKSGFDEFESRFFTKQKPLIMQPIWRTEGQSPIIEKDNAFDIFVWSDYAYTRLFLERSFIETKKGKKELTRMARCMIRVAGYLHDAGRARNNKADINEIFSKYTATKQSDKDLSASALVTKSFMTKNANPIGNCLLKPRVPRVQLKKIIINGGQKKLLPERRLDQSIYFTYNKK